jgi:hypothetical protein
MKKLLLVLVVLAAGCRGKTAGMETRTFELQRLSSDEALTLLTPYIRDGGLVSGRQRLITVREHADRLKVIEDLLKKYDGIGEAVDVVLDIRIVHANGVTTRDTALADVEQTLRETFRYQGYKLVGHTSVRTREDTRFAQTVDGAGSAYQVEGAVQRLRAVGSEQRVPIEIQLMGGLTRVGGLVMPRSEMKSTVTGIIGKPVVLGQSTGSGAVILIITPTVAGT